MKKISMFVCVLKPKYLNIFFFSRRLLKIKFIQWFIAPKILADQKHTWRHTFFYTFALIKLWIFQLCVQHLSSHFFSFAWSKKKNMESHEKDSEKLSIIIIYDGFQFQDQALDGFMRVFFLASLLSKHLYGIFWVRVDMIKSAFFFFMRASLNLRMSTIEA